MRTPLIIANWKMNKNIHESVEFVKMICSQLPSNITVGIAGQALALYSMKQAAGNSRLQIIAQNAAAAVAGPYTGEISMQSLAEIGVSSVILGHLERRRLFHESNAEIAKKVLTALHLGITPIICTDEEQIPLEVDGQLHYAFRQLAPILQNLSPEQVQKLVISYEPRWAVGASQSAKPVLAETGCRQIRQSVADSFGTAIADQVRILYGGSVNQQNIDQIVDSPNVDGALIGRASLDVGNFLRMLNFLKVGKETRSFKDVMNCPFCVQHTHG